MRSKVVTEQEARSSPICIGCGNDNDPGCMVCWTCFKRGPDPLKYSGVSFEEWQKRQPEIDHEFIKNAINAVKGQERGI